ncbi:protein cornichon homolog 4-like [Corticium candelabrum]|uniref:protein cornichon homolog 4-like n=1 Tax=Corticium candelabrum TaxID=121492 RepID=UPI002E268C7F|nr:protein cornichon homolog 4-like [Corticium candelabrum]
MGPDSMVFIFELIASTLLMFLTVYFIICLSDLECDYLNASSCCRKLNKLVVPEAAGHVFATLFLIIGFHYWIILLNVPLIVWHFYCISHIPKGNTGRYDPTEIHNRNVLRNFQKEAFVKLAWYLILFFVYLYSMIYSLVKGE